MVANGQIMKNIKAIRSHCQEGAQLCLLVSLIHLPRHRRERERKREREREREEKLLPKRIVSWTL